jgi:hypothetical protein
MTPRPTLPAGDTTRQAVERLISHSSHASPHVRVAVRSLLLQSEALEQEIEAQRTHCSGLVRMQRERADKAESQREALAKAISPAKCKVW